MFVRLPTMRAGSIFRRMGNFMYALVAGISICPERCNGGCCTLLRSNRVKRDTKKALSALKKTSTPDVNARHPMAVTRKKAHSAALEENKIAFFHRIHDKTGGPCLERCHPHPYHIAVPRSNHCRRNQRNPYGRILGERGFNSNGYRTIPFQTKYRRYFPTGHLFHPHAAKRQRYSPRIPNRNLQQRICRNQCNRSGNYSFFTHRYGRSAHPQQTGTIGRLKVSFLLRLLSQAKCRNTAGRRRIEIRHVPAEYPVNSRRKTIRKNNPALIWSAAHLYRIDRRIRIGQE